MQQQQQLLRLLGELNPHLLCLVFERALLLLLLHGGGRGLPGGEARALARLCVCVVLRLWV